MASVAILVTLEQILQAIRGLSIAERRQLLDRLDQDVSASVPQTDSETQVEPADFIGFLRGEPDLADELLRIGTAERDPAAPRPLHSFRRDGDGGCPWVLSPEPRG